MEKTEDQIISRDTQPRIHPSAKLQGTKLGNYVEIGERVILRDVTIGDFTYIERHSEGIYADIGRFSSIAANVRINALEHPMERLTTHKVTYRPNEYFRYIGLDADYRSYRQGRRVEIGHDVWVGHGSIIMPEVKIGNGAVIGANAVVTRDVEPYMIVAGSPARIIRPRFPEKIVERLEKIQWWFWPVEKFYRAIPDIQTMPIEAFLDKWEAIED